LTGRTAAKQDFGAISEGGPIRHYNSMLTMRWQRWKIPTNTAVENRPGGILILR